MHKQSKLTGFVLGVVLVFGLFILAMALSRTTDDSSRAPGPAPPGKVWSPEHGHWHDA